MHCFFKGLTIYFSRLFFKKHKMRKFHWKLDNCRGEAWLALIDHTIHGKYCSLYSKSRRYFNICFIKRMRWIVVQGYSKKWPDILQERIEIWNSLKNGKRLKIYRHSIEMKQLSEYQSREKITFRGLSRKKGWTMVCTARKKKPRMRYWKRIIFKQCPEYNTSRCTENSFMHRLRKSTDRYSWYT